MNSTNKKIMSKIKKLTFCFDIDNTICKTKGGKYEKSKPIQNAINTINKLYENGHIIKIFTARYMGRNKDYIKNKRKIYLKIKNQIDSWGLKYNKLIISKPSADIYIDDKSYGYNNKWIVNFKKYEKK